jgi:hypothetical protein
LSDGRNKIAGEKDGVIFVGERAKNAQQVMFLPETFVDRELLIPRDPSELQEGWS